MSSALVEQVRGLEDLPGVPEAVAQAREACTALRWHQALRRRIPEAAAESRVRGAAASALLEGAEPAGSRGTVVLARDLMRGAEPWPADPDPVLATLVAAAQVSAATEEVDQRALAAPAQVIARLHLAAGAPLLPAAQVGRPRRAGESCTELVADLGPAPEAADVSTRLAGIEQLVGLAASGRGPVLLLGALAHAELMAVRPFVRGNGLVARALERIIWRVGGLDPTGVAVPEVGHADKTGADYRGALAAYVQGGGAGVRLWLVHCGGAAARAARAGEQVADAVLAGRL